MKKKNVLLTVLIALLSTAPLLAQYSPCYEAAFAEGKLLFNEKKLYSVNRHNYDIRHFRQLQPQRLGHCR